MTGGLQTHTTVTGGVALYMFGIKASYSAENGVTELGLAGLWQVQYHEHYLQVIQSHK